jgi:FMN phosphatase YigB (HAD superfamily)
LTSESVEQRREGRTKDSEEIRADEEKDEERKARAKKESEEEKIREIIWKSLSYLQADVEALNKAINFNEENARKLAILINARSKVQHQIFLSIALLRNPKLSLTTDSGRNRDFARLIKNALLEEGPAAMKLVEEAARKTS